MSLQELLCLVPPPINPIGTGTEKDFLIIENQIGSKLPSDYKEYIKYYGDCKWYRHIIISTPFNNNENYSLWKWHKENIRQLTTLFESPLPSIKYPVFPNKGGIFLCGGDIFGEMIAWITEGEPDNWSVVYFSYDCMMFDRYDMNITTFLLKLVKNEIQPNCFGSARASSDNKPIVSINTIGP
jgi:hypothetical protein